MAAASGEELQLEHGGAQQPGLGAGSCRSSQSNEQSKHARPAFALNIKVDKGPDINQIKEADEVDEAMTPLYPGKGVGRTPGRGTRQQTSTISAKSSPLIEGLSPHRAGSASEGSAHSEGPVGKKRAPRWYAQRRVPPSKEPREDALGPALQLSSEEHTKLDPVGSHTAVNSPNSHGNQFMQLNQANQMEASATPNNRSKRPNPPRTTLS